MKHHAWYKTLPHIHLGSLWRCSSCGSEVASQDEPAVFRNRCVTNPFRGDGVWTPTDIPVDCDDAVIRKVMQS